MKRTHLELQCRRRDMLWDKIIDLRRDGDDEELLKLYEEELNEVENDIHNILYNEIKKEREKDEWL